MASPRANPDEGLYARGVRLAHRGYKLTLSPFIGQQCRFLPTCSDYGRDALIQHGPLRGGWLTMRRLCKCHPFGGSGYDPVPPPTKENGGGSGYDPVPPPSKKPDHD